MNSENEKQHIVGVMIEGERAFYACDTHSGGYPYFTPSVDSAERMTFAEARNIVTELQRPNTKEGFLNSLLMMAVSHQRSVKLRTDSPIIVEAEIYKICLKVVDSFEFIAQSNVDEVRAAQEEAKQNALAKLSDDERAALGF